MVRAAERFGQAQEIEMRVILAAVIVAAGIGTLAGPQSGIPRIF
jgi:hypothetical protein